jgi:hypothetical protein
MSEVQLLENWWMLLQMATFAAPRTAAPFDDADIPLLAADCGSRSSFKCGDRSVSCQTRETLKRETI